MSVVLEADGVGKSFGRRRVLTAASIRVRAGRITVLFGRNGCGKSTLLRCALGLVTPDWGSFRIAGMSLHRPQLHRLAAQGVFYVPERDLFARNRTVAQHFAALRRTVGAPGEAEAIRLLRVPDLLDLYPHQLSGGERRRAEFALALAREPACLIADEPFFGVAPHDVERIGAALRTLAARGCAILITGHEIAALLDIADDIVWMVAGTTHPLGTPAEATRHDQFRREYLGPVAPSAAPRAPGP